MSTETKVTDEEVLAAVRAYVNAGKRGLGLQEAMRCAIEEATRSTPVEEEQFRAIVMKRIGDVEATVEFVDQLLEIPSNHFAREQWRNQIAPRLRAAFSGISAPASDDVSEGS